MAFPCNLAMHPFIATCVPEDSEFPVNIQSPFWFLHNMQFQNTSEHFQEDKDQVMAEFQHGSITFDNDHHFFKVFCLKPIGWAWQ